MLSRVAIVTGAGTGIGQVVSLALLSDGWSVILAGRRSQPLEQVRTLAPAGKALAVSTDVSNRDSVRALFAKCKEAFGRLDLLFNNAGTDIPHVPVEEITFDQWMTIVDVNLTGVFLCCQEAFKMMANQTPRGGRIINNGSVSAHVPRINSAPYTATKHAITGLTKALSLDGRRHDIAVGQIDIGNAAVGMGAGSKAEPHFAGEHVGRAVLGMANLPLDANVMFMTLMATKMPLVGRG